MPMYDYQCASCGHQLEAIQKISDAPLVDCPACKAPELKKMLSMPGFRLSGSAGTRPTSRPARRRIWRAATKQTELNSTRRLLHYPSPDLCTVTEAKPATEFRITRSETTTMMRSHYCGQLNETLEGQEITLADGFTVAATTAG